MKKYFKKKKIEIYLILFFFLFPLFLIEDLSFIKRIKEKNSTNIEVVKELNREKNLKYFLLMVLIFSEVFIYKKIRYYLEKINESKNRLEKIRKKVNENNQLESLEDYYKLIKSIEKYMSYLDNINTCYQSEYEELEGKIEGLKDILVEVAVTSEYQYRYFTDASDKFNTLMGNILENNKRVKKLRLISKNTKKSTSHIIDESKSLKKLIEELFGSAKEIEKITELIEKLSFQTTILALNSSVESVRSGSDNNSSFDIISTEIHHLSTDSKRAASRVREISMSNSMKVIKMEETLDTTMQFIEIITKKVDNLLLLINNIKEVFDVEVEDIKELESLIKMIEKIVKESANRSKEVHSKSKELFDEVKKSVKECKIDYINEE